MQWGFSSQGSEIQVDENLPPFFSTIKHDQGQELIREYYNFKDNFGFEYSDHCSI